MLQRRSDLSHIDEAMRLVGLSFQVSVSSWKKKLKKILQRRSDLSHIDEVMSLSFWGFSVWVFSLFHPPKKNFFKRRSCSVDRISSHLDEVMRLMGWVCWVSRTKFPFHPEKKNFFKDDAAASIGSLTHSRMGGLSFEVSVSSWKKFF